MNKIVEAVANLFKSGAAQNKKEKKIVQRDELKTQNFALLHDTSTSRYNSILHSPWWSSPERSGTRLCSSIIHSPWSSPERLIAIKKADKKGDAWPASSVPSELLRHPSRALRKSHRGVFHASSKYSSFRASPLALRRSHSDVFHTPPKYSSLSSSPLTLRRSRSDAFHTPSKYSSFSSSPLTLRRSRSDVFHTPSKYSSLSSSPLTLRRSRNDIFYTPSKYSSLSSSPMTLRRSRSDVFHTPSKYSSLSSSPMTLRRCRSDVFHTPSKYSFLSSSPLTLRRSQSDVFHTPSKYSSSSSSPPASRRSHSYVFHTPSKYSALRASSLGRSEVSHTQTKYSSLGASPRWIEDGSMGTLEEMEMKDQEVLVFKSSEDGVSLRKQDEICEELGNLFRPKPNLSVLNQGGKGLTVPPNDEAWEEADEIHLMNNELSELPDTPNCPHLRVLLLQANPFLTVIPPSFFEHMISLQILDLSYTRIRSLPKSLFKLSELRNFLLRGCELFMEMPPEVGELSNLEVLDFEGTEIVSLPLEVGKLSKLKCLRLSFYGEDEDGRKNSWSSTTIIPDNVIGKLFQLQELSIDVNPEDERWNVIVKSIIKEVCSLNRLKALKLYLPEFVLLTDFMLNGVSFLTLLRFNFIVGGHLRRIISRLPLEPMLKFQQQQRCLKYVNGEDVPVEIKEVLQHATALFLDRHLTLRSLSEFGVENMKKLRVCVMMECKEIQSIVDEAEINEQEIVLGSLEYLSIHYTKNLKSIWKGLVQKGCLSRLKSLALRACPELTTIFTLDLLENLYNLEELVIENCPKIDTVVAHELLPAEEIQLCSVKHLPKLRKIYLHYMQNLVTISSGLCIAPEVEWMSFYGCPNLKTLSPMDVFSSNSKGIVGEVDWWNNLTPKVWPKNPNFTFFPVKGATELMKKLAEIGDQLHQ